MKTAILVLIMTLGGCANGEDQGDADTQVTETAQEIQTQTICDPFSGQCWVEEVGPYGPSGGVGSFQCELAPLPYGAYQCGKLIGYGPDGIHGIGVDLSTETWLEAYFSGHYNSELGFALVCIVDVGAGVNDQHATCFMQQGPWRWHCTVHLGEDPVCCAGSSACTQPM